MGAWLPLTALVLWGLGAPAAWAQDTNALAQYAADAGRMTALCDQLKPLEETGDDEARTTMAALTHWVQRPGAPVREGRAWAAALEAALARQTNMPNRVLLITLLQQLALEQSVPALSACLKEPPLLDVASRALAVIGGAAGRAPLVAALDGADDGKAAALLQALAEARWDDASRAASFAKSGSETVRVAACRALARMPSAVAAPPLAAAFEASSGRARDEIGMLLVRQARGLASLPEAQQLCRNVFTHAVAASNTALQCAAVSSLAAAGGEAAEQFIAGLLSHDLPSIRAHAARTLVAMPSPRREELIDHVAAPGLPPEVRIAFADYVAASGDKRRLPQVLTLALDTNEGVGAATALALARIVTPETAPDLVRRLAAPSIGGQAVAARALEMARAEGLDAALAEVLSAGPVEVKIPLLPVLAARHAEAAGPAVVALIGSESPEVRLAAVKAAGDLASWPQLRAAVLPVLVRGADENASAAAKSLAAAARRLGVPPEAAAWIAEAVRSAAPARAPLVVGLLPRLGDAASLELAVRLMGESALRAPALKALADWPDEAARPPLLDVARKTTDNAERATALRGYLRLISADDERRPAIAARIAEVIPLAATPEEKKMVLSKLSAVPCAAALAAAAGLVNDVAVRGEAVAAIVRMVAPGDDAKPMRVAAADRPAIEKAIAAATPEQKAALEKALPAPPANPDNLAAGRPAASSVGAQGAQTPDLAVDGKISLESSWWGSPNPATLSVDLGESKRIETVRVFFYWADGRYYGYRVGVSPDGQAWSVVADAAQNTEPASPAGVTHRFAPTAARWVRVEVLTNSANEAAHIVELEVYPAGKTPPVAKAVRAPAARRPARAARAAAAPGAAATPTAAAPAPVPPSLPPDAEGFTPLFNGKDLEGWVGDTVGYVVRDGVIVCQPGKGGKLYTARPYDNFHLKFEFKLTPGANNGLGIRTPRTGDPAYVGYEIQILDDTAEKFAKLEPWQYHGSIYKLAAPERGHLKPVGEWNAEEVIAEGDRIRVILNGVKIVDADVAKHGRPERGYIGFLGHGDEVHFRNIRLRDIPNIPPRGFTALFSGKDLTGWKGLVADPIKRAKMAPEDLAKAQAAADERMRAHWSAKDGVLVFDGGGDSLCTAKDYGDFELRVDWKIGPKGDSGIYLRGSPQVQIWDPGLRNIGSGGLYNNQKNPSAPSVIADRPVGEWNTFLIRMVGEKVSVWLNDTLVADGVTMENYWDRTQPIFPTGQIELQNHGNPLYFRSIFVREIPR